MRFEMFDNKNAMVDYITNHRKELEGMNVKSYEYGYFREFGSWALIINKR